MATLSKTVQSLLATGIGLPGMQDLLAAEPPEEGIEYRFTHYNEDPLPQSKLAAGDPRRYRIKSHQLRWLKNLDNRFSLTVDYLHETMSGSSPWYVIPNPAGPLQVMSGATIREKRDQIDLGLSIRHAAVQHNIAVGYSTEDDYEAKFAAYSGEYESDDKLRSWNWGLSISDDEIEPTDALEFGRVVFAERDSVSISAGITQVINKNAVVQTGLALTRQTGYLSDPYKLVFVAGFVEPDSRPDEREMLAWTTKFRHYIEATRGAVRVDYRFFTDDWKVDSHTLRVGWHQPFAEHWSIEPSVRYYTQTAPDFYGPFFFDRPDNGLWTSDYRLATYGALSYRLDAKYDAGRWLVSAGAEYYQSSESLALSGRPRGAPGLVDFWRLTLGIKFRL